MESHFLRCVLPPIVVDSNPRFAKSWLDIAPSGEDLEGNFFWVYGKLEDISWERDYKKEE